MTEDVIAELRQVSKTYGTGEAQVHALREVDLRLAPGEIVVVLGPSGSGKTTLLNVLGGIEPVTDGEAILAGQPLAGRSAEDLAGIRRETVSFVFQFFNLIQTLTAAENVEVIAELTGRAERDQTHAQVHAALAAVDMSERADHFPGQLSGGQQQRIAIARALVTRPRLLLCDEPTGALDLESGRQVLAQLQRAAREDGCCVVIVTHNAGIAVMADRVVRVHDGQIAEITEHRARPAGEVAW